MAELIVTDIAVTKLKQYLAENNIHSTLRVTLMQGGWSGPSLGLALDEPKDNDSVFSKDTLEFLVETSLLETTGNITVDYIDSGPRSGFGISSEKPISGGSCGSCSTCG